MELKITAEKQDLLDRGLMLPLMEQFYTIQGEGYHTGKAAWFIRLGGCDVGCHWCDVKESWNPDLYPLTSADEIVQQAERKSGKSKAVVITGGEPLAWNMGYLTSELNKREIDVFLETSGAYPLTGKWHWICLSPKKTAPPLKGIHQLANELKVIVYNQNDLIWAEEHAAQVSGSCKLYLQPEWSRAEKVLPFIIEYVKRHPAWNISLQAHKYMKIP